MITLADVDSHLSNYYQKEKVFRKIWLANTSGKSSRMWSTFHTIWPLPGSHVSRPIRASFFPLIKIFPFKNKHYSSLFSEAETVFSSNFISDHPAPVFVAPSRALFLAPLPLSPPSEQRSWIETCACWSSGVGGTAAGPRGWWPAGRGSSRSAASGWNRTAAPCSPLWPREVAVSEVSDRRVDQSKDRNWQRLRGREKPKRKQGVQRLVVWTVRYLISLRSPLVYGASPFGKLAIIFYLAAGRGLFVCLFVLIGIVLSNMLLQRTLKELTLLGKPERSLIDPHVRP